MNSFGAKLSNHVINMKFMRRTKDKVDKTRTEEKFRQHYAPSTPQHNLNKADILSCGSSGSKCVIEEVGSYSQCEGHIFGRQSFGGFNALLEQNVRSGIWRPFYLEGEGVGPGEEEEEESESEVKRKKEEMEVSDEEMAKHYGSLVATLGKKFGRKKGRGTDQPPPNKRIKMDHEEKRTEKKKGWKGLFGKKGGQEGQSSAKRGRGGQSSTKRGRGGQSSREIGAPEPPALPPSKSKNKKFMKPQDD